MAFGRLNRLGMGMSVNSRRGASGFSAEMLDLFLFYGKMSDVVGGQMPNLVGSDYITVAGSAGDETFQCPNTAEYIAADTENFLFTSGAVRRTVTFAEAIGYDTQRTIFKYDSYAPYTIREVIILKPDTVLTSSQINKIMATMDLNPWWTGTWRDYGSVKENRAFEYTPWIP